MKYTKKLFFCSLILVTGLTGIFSGAKVDAMGNLRRSPFVHSFENISEEEMRSFGDSSLSVSIDSEEEIILPKFTRGLEFSPKIVRKNSIDRNLINFNRCYSCTIALACK